MFQDISFFIPHYEHEAENISDSMIASVERWLSRNSTLEEVLTFQNQREFSYLSAILGTKYECFDRELGEEDFVMRYEFGKSFPDEVYYTCLDEGLYIAGDLMPIEECLKTNMQFEDFVVF